MSNLNWPSIAAIIISCAVAVALIWLLKKKMISQETIGSIADALDSIKDSIEYTDTGTGFVSQLYEYARLAVHAVEQLAKTGVIESTPEAKKAAAMSYMEHFAELDDAWFCEAGRDVADALIEAAVQELPHSQK